MTENIQNMRANKRAGESLLIHLTFVKLEHEKQLALPTAFGYLQAVIT